MVTRPRLNAGRCGAWPFTRRARAASTTRFEQVAVDVVGDPACELLEVARAGEDLDDAVREVPEQRLGVGEVAAARGLTTEVVVVIVEVLQGSTSCRGAAGGRACGHLGSMRGWRRPRRPATDHPRSGDVRGHP